MATAWQWGCLSPSPISKEAQLVFLAEEKTQRPKLIKKQQGCCSACNFPAKNALRGHYQNEEWVGVCPVCFYALDWTRAPSPSYVLYFPELENIRFNRLLHVLYLWMDSENEGMAETADTIFDHLNTRLTTSEKILNTHQAMPKQIIDAYWRLPKEKQPLVSERLKHFRLIPFPVAMEPVTKYWEQAVYPSLRKDLSS